MSHFQVEKDIWLNLKFIPKNFIFIVALFPFFFSLSLFCKTAWLQTLFLKQKKQARELLILEPSSEVEMPQAQNSDSAYERPWGVMK